MRCFAQFLMRKAQIVGASHQIHARFQRTEAACGVPALAREDRQPFTEGPIDALNERRIPHRPSFGALQQGVRLLLLPIGQGSRDFHDVFLFRALDHRHNAEILPHA